MGVRHLEGHVVRTQSTEAVCGMLKVRSAFISKRPGPSLNGIAASGQAGVRERRFYPLAHVRCDKRRHRGGMHSGEIVGHVLAPKGIGDRDGKQVRAHRGQRHGGGCRSRCGRSIGQHPCVGGSLSGQFFSRHQEVVATFVRGQLQVNLRFAMNFDHVCGLGRTRSRLAVEPHFHHDLIRAGRVVRPCHVSGGGWDPRLACAVKVPLERVGFRRRGVECDGFSFTDVGRAAHRGGKGFSNHNRDGRAIDATTVLHVQRDGVRSHTREGQRNGVGVGPQSPVDSCDASWTCGSTEVPPLFSVFVVAVVQAVLFGQVSNVNGVVGPAQHELRSANGCIVTVPYVHVVDAHRRGHSKFPCPALVGGRQRDFALTSRGEGLIQMIHRGTGIFRPRRE